MMSRREKLWNLLYCTLFVPPKVCLLFPQQVPLEARAFQKRILMQQTTPIFRSWANEIAPRSAILVNIHEIDQFSIEWLVNKIRRRKVRSPTR